MTYTLKLLAGALFFFSPIFLEAVAYNGKYQKNTRFNHGNMPYYSHYSRYYNEKGVQITNTPYSTNGYYYGDSLPNTLIYMPDKYIFTPLVQDWPGVEENTKAIQEIPSAEGDQN